MISTACLDAVVQITEQFDRRAMAERLVMLLHKILPTQGVALYDVYHCHRAKEVEQSAADELCCRDVLQFDAPELTLADNAPFLRVVQKGETVTAEGAEGRRVICPIPGRGGITGLLEIESRESLDGTLEYLHYLLRIYANHALLLDKKERDALTGLFNRQSFDDRIAKVLSYQERKSRRQGGDGGKGACLALFDIDHFKRINDRFGHLYGDEVLLLFARQMEHCFRFSDLLFRYGGEEFVALLNDVDDEQAAAVLERFRQTIESYPFPKVGRVTVSVGYVHMSPDELPSVLHEFADKALYYSKNNGRNQVNCYERLVAEGRLEEEKLEEGEIELF